jgi:hypothetical protein
MFPRWTSCRPSLIGRIVWFISRPETDRPLEEQTSATAPLAKLGLGTLFSGLIAFGFGLVIGDGLYDAQHPKQRGLVSEIAPSVVAERIICAESNGDPNAKNKHSSAAGAAQFIDETWLHMIRAHRPDFGRMSNKEALDLRRDPELAREMTMRLLERSATMLKRRGLPVTAGTLYLSHFAGGAGAVALLLAADADDAASVMVRADVTGHTKRERLVSANPFLNNLTVADLKSWADKKMRKSAGPPCRPAVSPAAVTRV